MEVGRLEAGGWRLEAGGWRLETGDWRLETGDWRLEGCHSFQGSALERTAFAALPHPASEAAHKKTPR